jgi:hypothetical protein
MLLIGETELPQLDDLKACDEWEGATNADSKHSNYTASFRIAQQVSTRVTVCKEVQLIYLDTKYYIGFVPSKK